MCGIIGYIGTRPAYPILIKGLKRLEYRGYDSAGVAISDKKFEIIKTCGKVSDLENIALSKKRSGSVGIGHTRWATHGAPTDINAHPHVSFKGYFFLVHNGIIENCSELKKELLRQGYQFMSDTDSEIIVNLIEYFYTTGNDITAEYAVQLALSGIKGSYSIAVLCKREEDKIIAARRGSPLLAGIGISGYFISSDISAISEYTNHVLYLKDNDLAIIRRNSFSLRNIKSDAGELTISSVHHKNGEIDKGRFKHYMLKEIFSQPESIEKTLKGCLEQINPESEKKELFLDYKLIAHARRIMIIGCGTSWHAALIGKYLIEEYSELCVDAEYASEFRYRNPALTHKDVVILISQSGETADTLAALNLAKEKGAFVIGICNVKNSTLARKSDTVIYTMAGLEIGVASTKAFTAQLTVMGIFAFKLARVINAISEEEFRSVLTGLAELPSRIGQILKNSPKIMKVAEKYKQADKSLYLGRGLLFPVALEGALKLKEISYIHAEGFAAGEIKHGPLALVDESIPVIVAAPANAYYEKTVNSIREVKARKGKVIAIVTEGDTTLAGLAEDIIEIPETHPALLPILVIIPLQLLAYHIADLRGCSVDQPRNLAKSVTVE